MYRVMICWKSHSFQVKDSNGDAKQFYTFDEAYATARVWAKYQKGHLTARVERV